MPNNYNQTAGQSLNIQYTTGDLLFLSDNGASTITLSGFKLEESFFTTSQVIDNSKVVPLLNGNTITILNNTTAGYLTLNCTNFGPTIANGNIVLLAQYLQARGSAYGGQLIVSWDTTFNAGSNSITFNDITVANVPALMLAGNDVVTYPVKFAYGSYTNNFLPAVL